METRFEFTIDLHGLDRFSDGLAAGLAAALETEGQAFVADAQSRAPVLTGFLRDNIGYAVSGSAASDAAAAEPLTLTLTSAAEYSAFQEFGTRFVAAHPFFTPALDQMTARLPQTIATAVQEAEATIP